MQLVFKQRAFSWFDSYDIYNTDGQTVYTVKGQLSWGHCLKIFDAFGNEVGTVQERVFTWLPKFEMYVGQRCIGTITKEFSLFKPSFQVDCNGWCVEGDWLEWDYVVRDALGGQIAKVSKELMHWTDTYQIKVYDPNNALSVLMLVLAIDAEKCSRNA